MYNKEEFDKIIKGTCPFDELEAFVSDIHQKEFDTDNAFEKYYNIQIILSVIQRYENKEIDDEYLSCWMHAYNWIIMAGFKTESENKEFSFHDWVEWEISNWLDGLTWFDDSTDEFNIEEYKNSFIIINKIYENLNDWDCLLAHTDECGELEDIVALLAINYKAKEFVKMYGDLSYLDEDVEIEKMEFDELKKKIEQLKLQGFSELRYGFFCEKAGPNN